ncbi:hypothetical protein BGZ99_005243 [Dissophora globulifera]|uniref:JmjC domain-containing protein n=1 Tax=Dissophora globulifera TaxID=979702 RepID=A0A9P6RFT0_9FUNG|nr:hypothetical protein BGZ99_005243 [Dissophora globulifera]
MDDSRVDDEQTIHTFKTPITISLSPGEEWTEDDSGYPPSVPLSAQLAKASVMTPHAPEHTGSLAGATLVSNVSLHVQSSITVQSFGLPPRVGNSRSRRIKPAVHFDKAQGRIRYTHPNPVTTLSDHHRVVLKAAYNANQFDLDGLTDEDYEFIALMAETTPSSTKSYFQELRSLESHIGIPVKRRRGRPPKDSTLGGRPSTAPRRITAKKVRTVDRPAATEVVHTRKRPVIATKPSAEVRPTATEVVHTRNRPAIATKPSAEDRPTSTEVAHTRKHPTIATKPSAEDRPTVTEVVHTRKRPAIATKPSAEDSSAVVMPPSPPYIRVLQPYQCRGLCERSSERCVACTTPKMVSGACRFRYFRYLASKTTDGSHRATQEPSDRPFFSDTSADERLKFNKSALERADILYILSFTHAYARDLLEREIRHVEHASRVNNGHLNDSNKETWAPLAEGDTGGYFRRPSADRQYCDHCKISMASGYWMCGVCGEEMCMDCYGTISNKSMCTKSRRHTMSQFVPCGKFHLSTLQWFKDSLKRRKLEIPDTSHPHGRRSFTASEAVPTEITMVYREPMRAVAKEVTQDEFRVRWTQGDAIVLSGQHELWRQSWSPESLVKHTGNTLVTAMQAGSGRLKRTSVKKYFRDRFGSDAIDRRWRISARDFYLLLLLLWPAMAWRSEIFQDDLKELRFELVQTLPLPQYTQPFGVYNLSRYFPVGRDRFELSPRLHVAQGSQTEERVTGDIPLSCELWDAVYTCVYTETASDSTKKASEGHSDGTTSSDTLSSSVAVIWEVYREEDRFIVQQFIDDAIEESGARAGSSILHSPVLSAEQQQELYWLTGVRPFQVLQHYGDAVMIPAGSLRQARFVQDTILVAVGFVSPERLPSTIRRSEELRRLSSQKHFTDKRQQQDSMMDKDVLFYSTLAML